MNKKPIYAPIEIKGTEDRKLQANGGDGSRSIRKRAYYRALKRGEAWAMARSKMSAFNRFFHEMYYSKIQDAYNSKNSFVSGLKSLIDDDRTIKIVGPKSK